MADEPSAIQMRVTDNDGNEDVVDLPSNGPMHLSIGPDLVDVSINENGHIQTVDAFLQRVWEFGLHTFVADMDKVFVIIEDHYSDPEMATMKQVETMLFNLGPESAQRVIDWVTSRLLSSGGLQRPDEPA